VAAPGSVFTITRVAKILGEDVDWLENVALEMDPEDGRLAVYCTDDEGTIAFPGFGIENLKELIEIQKADPTILERYRIT
jgi:hypothetical protein